jgi:hypothetical protein
MKLRISTCFVIGLFLAMIAGTIDAQTVIWDEDFESGIDNWYTDHGVWQVGEPTAGPSGAYEGSSVAGTNLSGNYPSDTDSRLISPSLNLPGVGANERIFLRFWQWYSYSNDDRGDVQISVWDGSEWGDWTTLSNPAQEHGYSDWSLIAVDVTAYAGEQVRIGFYHLASVFNASSGWYIDGVEAPTDYDEDGVLDGNDNCPCTYNPEQEDRDGDGNGDACDGRPDNPNWVTTYGSVTFEGTSLCAMVLANGQYMFTCGDDLGLYNLDVPLDENGEITLYGFCSGFSPFKTTLGPEQFGCYDISMVRAAAGIREMEIAFETEPGTTNLEVPLDGNGEITLYVFCSGKAPYKKVFAP